MDPNQAYVDAAALQAVEGMPMQMDAAAIAAAAQQLEAIQAALQQAGGTLGTDQAQAAVAALEHLHSTKPEDYFAQLAAMSAAAANTGVDNAPSSAGGVSGMQGDLDGGEPVQTGGDKPLTSRFRGVCWNKKNRRWQAAINSSGKYIYLGSFVQEEEAARAFDRAAIRLRGNRAKLNYSLTDYMDDQGNLVDDPRLSAHLQNVLGKDGGKGGKPGSTDGHDPSHALLASAANSQGLLYGQNLAQHIMAQSAKSDHYPYNGARKHNYGVLEVPEGCSLVAHIPGDEEAFAVLYVGPTIPSGGAGASVWDGTGAIDLGGFDTDKDARQAAGAMLKLCMFHRQTLMNAIATATGVSASSVDLAAAAAQANAAAAAQQYGLLLGGADGAGIAAGTDPNDAAAMAAAAAAAAASAAAGTGDSQALAQLGLASLGQNLAASADAQNQYKDLFAWIANYTQQGRAALKPEEQAALEGGGATSSAGGVSVSADGMNAQTEAEMAGAEVMAALMAQAQSLKTARDGEQDGQSMQGQGYESVGGASSADEHSNKRARPDDGIAQLKQLSGHKLQDMMRSLFDPRQQQGAAS